MESNAPRTSLPSLKPPDVCKTCWWGPCTALFGLFHPPTRLNDGCRRYTYSTSAAQVKQGAAGGCLWCQWLSPLRLLDGQWKITLVGRTVVEDGLLPAMQELRVVVNDRSTLMYGYVHTSADDPAAPYISARHPVPEVGSSRALSLAQSLMDQCVDGHQSCSHLSPSSDTRLPTRTIDCSDPSRPRLASTEGSRGRYLALSYVWGETQPHRTTTANIATYTHGIDAALLPKTLRDAIYVTHALGSQYLWADSLCIIQDSDEDKIHELGRMHLIYRYAHLTIIAASAKRVGDGFLHEPTATPPDVSLPFICPPRQLRDARPLIGTMGISAIPSIPRIPPQEPIMSRGWCLQEYLMSQRALIFSTSGTLQVRCHTATQVIGGAYHTPNPEQSEQRLPHALLHADAPRVKPNSAAWSALHSAWWEIVDDYSRRTVSDPSDKLVACSAIAEAFSRGLCSYYLAGLWLTTLRYDLLWEPWDPSGGPSLSRPATYRAPSWSWASVDGRVRMPGYRIMFPTAEVVRHEIELKDPELRFGRVTGGFLVLRAGLVPWAPGLQSYDVKIDTAADVDTARHGAWLLPLLQSGKLDALVGLVVAPVGSGGSAAKGRDFFRRIGTFSKNPQRRSSVDELDVRTVRMEVVLV